MIYAALDDRDRALEWLDRAVDERSNAVVYLAIDPLLDRVRGGCALRCGRAASCLGAELSIAT